MYDDHSRILSRPLRVMWGGFETTTTRLQQCGWEISAEQDIRRNAIRLALRHSQFQIYGITNSVDYDFYSRADRFSYRDDTAPTFQVVHMSSRLTIQIRETDMSMFQPIDAMPQFTSSKITSIEDLGVFATPLVRTEEIIVEPQTVEALLDQIKKMQAPEQSAIRQRNRLRESREGIELGALPRQKFHAQILSVA